MNKLTAALIAGGFALMSVAAMADDKTPSATTPADQAKMKSDAVEASKAQPKVAPDAKAKLDAEKSMEKNAGKSQ